MTCMSASRPLLSRSKHPLQDHPAHHWKCQHQQPEHGLKKPVFAGKINTAVTSAGSVPTTPSCPMLLPTNEVLCSSMQYCACSTLSQQLPAQTEQPRKQHRQQHSKTTAEHKHQPHTHTRGLHPKVLAGQSSQKDRLLVHCCGCG